MSRTLAILARMGIFVAVGLTFGAFMALILMWLWNWLVPSLFRGPLITFWQSWGLMILLSLLSGVFKSTSGGK